MTEPQELSWNARSVEISALTDNQRSEPSKAFQFAVRDEKGSIKIFGDQEWIRDGRAAEEIGGVTIPREVTFTFGEWQEVEEAPEECAVVPIEEHALIVSRRDHITLGGA
jgi:hypothetical protein